MKNKYIVCNLLLFMFVLSLSSCFKEENDIFGTSAAERLIMSAKEYEEILSSAENGWAMDYYAEKEPNKLGGRLILCSFDKGKVTMAGAFTVGSYTNPGTQISSSYSIIDSQGPVLSFTTHNDVLHSFADPGSAWINPDGFAGDYEFTVVSASKDRIEMRGLKHKLKIVMRPIPAAKDWTEFCNEAMELEETLKSYARFQVNKGGQSIGFVTLWGEDNEMHETESSSATINKYTVINQGINLYDSITVDGNVIHQLTWDRENKIFTDVEDSEISMHPIQLAYEQYIGTFDVVWENNDEPVTVTISPKGDDKTLRVSKELIGYEFDMVVEGNKLAIKGQTLDVLENGHYMKLAVATSTNLLITTSNSYSFSYAYYGSWYKGNAEKPVIQFMKTGFKALFFTTYSVGIRVIEYNKDSTNEKDIVELKDQIMYNPIFSKQ